MEEEIRRRIPNIEITREWKRIDWDERKDSRKCEYSRRGILGHDGPATVNHARFNLIFA
jgi:hypothetical protein